MPAITEFSIFLATLMCMVFNNLILFPTHIFNIDFFDKVIGPLPLFPNWYSSQLSKYNREEDYCLFPLFHIMFFHRDLIFSSPPSNSVFFLDLINLGEGGATLYTPDFIWLKKHLNKIFQEFRNSESVAHPWQISQYSPCNDVSCMIF